MDFVDLIRDLGASLTYVEDKLWVLHKHLNVEVYDFDFEAHFECSHPYRIHPGPIVSRIGAIENYSELFDVLKSEGLQLFQTPAQYGGVTSLPEWYPRIEEFTPTSVWFDSPPTAAEVAKRFDWPVFVKGERQTNRHSAASVVHSPAEFDKLMSEWDSDPILGWQRIVVREFVPLRKVDGDTGSKVAPSFEFRTFWFDGECIGSGPYWKGFADYDWEMGEKAEALNMVSRFIDSIDARFVTVDLAQTQSGDWVVIELNSSQESGYAGVDPVAMWSRLLEKIA